MIHRYVEALQGVPSEWHSTLLQLVDLIKEDIRSEVSVRREEFLDLKTALGELAQAQRRTEERVEELAQAQRRTEERVEELAQAQRRTEERVEELVQAQKELVQAQKELVQAQRHTEEQVRKLARAQEIFQGEVAARFRGVEAQLGAIGARWGFQAEESFRSAIEGILREDLSMHVERYLTFDPEGVVFGDPDQVEIDVLIRNGKTTLIEIKSSMSKADVYAFKRKVAFFEKQTRLKADRKIIISPMLGRHARKTIEALGMIVYTTTSEMEQEREASS